MRFEVLIEIGLMTSFERFVFFCTMLTFTADDFCLVLPGLNCYVLFNRIYDQNIFDHCHFELEYFLNEEIDGVLTDTQDCMREFSELHLACCLKPNVKVGQSI